jgi:hypothetical protein
MSFWARLNFPKADLYHLDVWTSCGTPWLSVHPACLHDTLHIKDLYIVLHTYIRIEQSHFPEKWFLSSSRPSFFIFLDHKKTFSTRKVCSLIDRYLRGSFFCTHWNIIVLKAKYELYASLILLLFSNVDKIKGLLAGTATKAQSCLF